MQNSVKRCTKCVLSSEFPNIDFDDNGVCSFCRDKMYFVAEDGQIDKSRIEIGEMFSAVRGKNEYDAIMCYSGGKDSTYTLKLAVEKYKLKVLAFTLDNGFISGTAFENINRVVDFLGVDLVTYRPSFKFMKSLIRATSLNKIYNKRTLTRISANCNSCITLVNIAALRIALEKKIPFILAGFTLGQIPLNSIIFKNSYRFFQDSREPVLKKYRELIGPQVDEYMCIKDSLLNSVESDPHNINLLCIEDINEEKILNEVGKIGWIAPKDVDGCSSNCRLNAFNNYVHEKSMGYNPYELELSHLIRKGKLTREEALNKISDKSEQQIQSISAELEFTKQDIDGISTMYNK